MPKPTPILALCLLALLFPLSGPVFAQTEKPEKKGPTEESKKLLSDSIDALKAAQKEDLELETKRCMKLVAGHFKGGDKKLKKSALSALARQLKARNMEMKLATLKALSQTGPGAAKILKAEIKRPAAKNSLTYKCECIKTLGQLADPKTIDYLLKLLHNKDVDVTAQGIEALGYYKEVKTKYRKDIVKELLKFYGPLEGAARMPTAKTSIVRKYTALKPSFQSTLTSITGKVDAKTAAQWATWFRKVGKKLKKW